mgnify:FL=1
MQYKVFQIIFWSIFLIIIVYVHYITFNYQDKLFDDIFATVNIQETTDNHRKPRWVHLKWSQDQVNLTIAYHKVAQTLFVGAFG